MWSYVKDRMQPYMRAEGENLSHPEAAGLYVQFLGRRSVVCDACHGKLDIPIWWRGTYPFPDPDGDSLQSLAARDMVDQMVNHGLMMHKLNLDFNGIPLSHASQIPRCKTNGFVIPASLAQALRIPQTISHQK